MNSNSYLVQTYQSGISLGEREYYLDNDPQTSNIRNKYKEHVVKMFQLFGFTEAVAKQNMESVLKIETRLAKAAYDQVKLRDPHANYNKMSIATCKSLFPLFNGMIILKRWELLKLKISVFAKRIVD